MKGIFLSIRKRYQNFIDRKIHLLIGIAVIDLLVIGLAVLLVCGIVKSLMGSNEIIQGQSGITVPITMQGDNIYDN